MRPSDLLRRAAASVVIGAVGFLPQPASADPQTPSPTLTGGQSAGALRDGRHDFDFNIGTWRTHIARLVHPLTGSTTWYKMEGDVVVKKVWNGRASLEEVEADGPRGHFEDIGLFLYNPAAHQWTQTFANVKYGTVNAPMTGEFKNGRGEFYDQEPYDGRMILARVIWSNITPNSHRFQQAFSADGGRTWETNMIANLTRESSPTVSNPPSFASGAGPEHAFDFDLGTWKMHIARLVHPLTGSTTWTKMEGTTTTRQIWNGRADLAEVEADGPPGHLELLALRLYNPDSKQWSIAFATSRAGVLGTPSIGEFKAGRGEFYDQELYDGRSILVRFTIFPTGAKSAHSEQAFSPDHGRTWEVNWINNFTRIKGSA